MSPFSTRSTPASSSQGAARGPASQYAADRQIIALGALLTAIALAYFYLADNLYFSTRLMSPIFQFLLMVDDFKTAWLSLTVYILALCWKKPEPVLMLVDFVGAHMITIPLAIIGALAIGTVFIYHNNALCMDEYAAVFQAKIFAAGQLSAHLPPSVIDWLIPRGFNGEFLIASRTTGQAIEAYWPGFALILALFQFFGVAWLCNASLAGLAAFLIHRITFELTHDQRAAGWAVLFTVASGSFVANAISYYSMQAHLTANLLFVWLLLKPTTYRAFTAGLVGSLALILHNPFPHALFAAPWIIAIARSKDQQRAVIPLALGYMPLLIVVGAGWLRLRGIITSGNSGYNVIGDSMTSAFSLPDKSMIDMRIAAMVKMWIWAVPALFLFAVVGRLRRGGNPHVRLLAQSAVVTFIAYLFVVFDQGHGWGYRYFHSAWGVVPILAACAMTSKPDPNGRLTAFAGAVAMLNLVLVVPYQLTQIESIISRHSAQLPTPRRPGNNIYFVKVTNGFYAADLVQMDPRLRSDDLILASQGPQLDAELRRQNWPTAMLVDRGFSVEEWHMGPLDGRHASQDTSGVKQFVFAYSNPSPSQ